AEATTVNAAVPVVVPGNGGRTFHVLPPSVDRATSTSLPVGLPCVSLPLTPSLAAYSVPSGVATRLGSAAGPGRGIERSVGTPPDGLHTCTASGPESSSSVAVRFVPLSMYG